MTRGGKREGAGRKPAWKSKQKETKTVRLPVQLADALIRARDAELSVGYLIKAINLLIKKNEPVIKSTQK